MDIGKYSRIQYIARQVLRDLSTVISADSTEQSIATRAKELLVKYGVTETWYHDVPAFVLLGSRSCLSISGRDYIPATEPVGSLNLVTVDLSPCIDNIWGDYARSFMVENGRVVSNPKYDEFNEGVKMERHLHKEMQRYVTSQTTFSDLFEFGNRLITEHGWENLDFLQNLGHSIETKPEYRRFIDRDCLEQLGAVNYFTFEPHIRKRGTHWGFKHENIYYFDERGKVNEL